MSRIRFGYKGYIGVVTDIDGDGFLNGKVIGLSDVITFASKTPKSLEKEFQKSVDEYLAFCMELGRPPQKTHSGKFQVRIPVELHGAAAIVAESFDMSLNDFVSRSIKHAVDDPDHIGELQES